MLKHNTDINNVLIIGCGGAGLRAAIQVKQNNLSVKVLGKRPMNDSHTVLAAGGINASFANLDPLDSWEQHFIDTFIEGYEIGDYKAIEIMAKNAKEAVEEIDSWGANFQKLDNNKFDQRFFGAHTYRRTCYSGDYTGQSILQALLKKSHELKIPIFDQEYVTELLVTENECFGAMSFNISTGERTIHLADSIILCTGGHTRIWKKSSSRKFENFGDGFYLGIKKGCELVDMEMVQFHPTGMLLPEDLSGTLVTEAVRGEGGLLFNKFKERFMKNYDEDRMELSSRDTVAKANYTEIMEGRGTKNGGIYLDISHKDKEFIIAKIPKIYRQFIETQMLDISKFPMEVAPTAHYSMGGLVVDPEKHSTNINGLFAAGEVVGGLHGANRLGGNSLAEILIFGKIAGQNASNFSKNLTKKVRSQKAIYLAHENIDKLIKRGDYLAIPIQNELRDIMWKYCGVVKNGDDLNKGLAEINRLKKQVLNIDVRIEDKNFIDLINLLDLKASLISAEATFMSAISREETRGSHIRKDFPNLDANLKFNNRVKMKNDSLEIFRKEITSPKKILADLIKKSKRIKDFSGKLIE